MLPSDFRELYRETVATKALLVAGVAGGIVYVVALAAIIIQWPRASTSMPSIIGIYVAIPYGVGAFAAMFVLAACWFGVQEFLRRRRDSNDNT
jgi:hypothetical protein